MGKYLDSIYYNKIVLNTFQLPESDFLKYYSNVVEEYLANNSDLFDELIAAIERRINWHRGLYPIDYSQEHWLVDEDGNKKLIPLRRLYEEFDDVYYPLPPELGIGKKINKSFFDEQIRIVRLLSIQHSILNAVSKVKGREVKRKVKTFESLFSQKEIAKNVIDILTNNEYLVSEVWSYPGDDKSIVTPFYVLRDYFGLIKQDGLQNGTKLRIWCSGLGITVNTNNIKSLKNNPDTDGKRPTLAYRRTQKEFFKLFELHFKPIKQLV